MQVGPVCTRTVRFRARAERLGCLSVGSKTSQFIFISDLCRVTDILGYKAF
jgi:hypothetical protein